AQDLVHLALIAGDLGQDRQQADRRRRQRHAQQRRPAEPTQLIPPDAQAHAQRSPAGNENRTSAVRPRAMSRLTPLVVLTRACSPSTAPPRSEPWVRATFTAQSVSGTNVAGSGPRRWESQRLIAASRSIGPS